MVQARDENFPVALWLLGPRTRRHFLAIYGFARLVDDIGDEATGDRLALLDQVERELDAPEHPVMRALAATVRECRLPREPFLRLIEANRRDQVITSYESVRRAARLLPAIRPPRSASSCCTCSAPRPRSGSRSRTGSAPRSR